MALPTESQLLQQARLGYAQILAFITTMGGNPTPAQVTAFFASIQAVNTGLPPYLQIAGPGQITHTVGDETYNWTEYQTFVIDKMQALRIQQQQADGPWYISSRRQECW